MIGIDDPLQLRKLFVEKHMAVITHFKKSRILLDGSTLFIAVVVHFDMFMASSSG